MTPEERTLAAATAITFAVAVLVLAAIACAAVNTLRDYLKRRIRENSDDQEDRQ